MMQSMPHTIYQWLVFAGVETTGIFVSLGLGWVFMQRFLNPDTIAEQAANRAQVDYRNMGHLGTALQGWVGAIEILLYSSSIVFGYPQFIAVWLGTKYLAAYKTWGSDPVGRTFYNRSLFGSGLNILIGAATGGGALLAVRHIH
jgi:hypothetical protein